MPGGRATIHLEPGYIPAETGTAMLLLAACAPPPDPSDVLVDLAVEAGTDLCAALHFGVGEDTLGAMVDGDTTTGEVVMPGDIPAEHWASDGELHMSWQVSRRDGTLDDGWPRYWDWHVELEIERLALPAATVSGNATWTPIYETYDSTFIHHTWTGTLFIDGAAPVDVAWSGTSTAAWAWTAAVCLFKGAPWRSTA
jgi:hypothetical protein